MGSADIHRAYIMIHDTVTSISVSTGLDNYGGSILVDRESCPIVDWLNHWHKRMLV